MLFQRKNKYEQFQKVAQGETMDIKKFVYFMGQDAIGTIDKLDLSDPSILALEEQINDFVGVIFAILNRMSEYEYLVVKTEIKKNLK